MKTPSPTDFRSASRTVVTEIRTFLVDTLSRTGAFRQSVSARVLPEHKLDRQDFNVNKNSQFELDDCRAVLAVSSVAPIVLVFQQTEPAFQETETRQPAYTRAILKVDAFSKAGFPVEFSIFDPDLPESVLSLEAVVYNTLTGETEYVTARRNTSGEYAGQIETMPSLTKGEDFDGVMSVKHDTVLEIMFNDTTVLSTDDPLVKASTTIISPYNGMQMESVQTVFPDAPVPVRVVFDLFAGLGVIHVYATNMSSGEEERIDLRERMPGEFVGMIPTITRYPHNTVSLDGVLSVQHGDSLQLSFTKDLSLICSDTQFFTVVQDERNFDGVFRGPASTTVGSVVEMFIYDYNLRGYLTLDVPVLNVDTRKFQMIAFNEVMPFSGIFRAAFTVTDKTTPLSSSSIPASEGETITLTYIDSSSTTSQLTKVEHTISISPLASLESVAKESLRSDSSSPSYGEVSFLVNGLFYLNGAFNGKLLIKGTLEEDTRCLLIRS